jgi:predicted 2-oxoglutarate/Fe(II)-dependent dioxygenase YbiX
MNTQTVLTPIIFKNIFTEKECDYIKNIVKWEDYIPATVETSERNHSVNTQDRKVLNQSLPNLEKYKWIYKRIFLCINKANQKFKFDIAWHNLDEVLILKYWIWDFYRKHKDVWWWDAAGRRLSVIVQLSNEHDYDGCELIFEKWNLTAPKNLWSIIVFPSCLTHEVTTLIQWERYALVSWFKRI